MFEHPLLVAAKVAVLVLGALVAGVSFASWRRTRGPLMLRLAAAFALLALASFAEGVAFEFFGFDLLTASAVESVLVLAGLCVLVAALWPAQPPLKEVEA